MDVKNVETQNKINRDFFKNETTNKSFSGNKDSQKGRNFRQNKEFFRLNFSKDEIFKKNTSDDSTTTEDVSSGSTSDNKSSAEIRIKRNQLKKEQVLKEETADKKEDDKKDFVKQKVIINASCTDDVKDNLKNIYPEFELKFVDSHLPSHAYAEASRVCENMLLYNRAKQYGKVIDIGGDFFFHYKHKHEDVHCCAPILDAKDGARYTLRCLNTVKRLMMESVNENESGKEEMKSDFETELKRELKKINVSKEETSSENDSDFSETEVVETLEEFKNEGMKIKEKTKIKEIFDTKYRELRCIDKAEDCEVQGMAGMATHSIYDIEFNKMGDIMRKHGLSVMYGSFIFSPAMTNQDRGFIEKIGAYYDIDVKKDRIKFSFKNDMSTGYSHCFSNYFRYVTEHLITANDGTTYVYELMENRNGVQFFRIVNAMGMHFNEDALPFRNLWLDLKDYMYVNLYDYGDEPNHNSTHIDSTRDLHMTRVAIPKSVVETGYTHALKLARKGEGHTPGDIYDFLISYSSRVIVFGTNITTPEKVEGDTLVKLSTVLAALSKHTAIKQDQAYGRLNEKYTKRLKALRSNIFELGFMFITYQLRRVLGFENLEESPLRAFIRKNLGIDFDLDIRPTDVFLTFEESVKVRQTQIKAAMLERNSNSEIRVYERNKIKEMEVKFEAAESISEAIAAVFPDVKEKMLQTVKENVLLRRESDESMFVNCVKNTISTGLKLINPVSYFTFGAKMITGTKKLLCEFEAYTIKFVIPAVINIMNRTFNSFIQSYLKMTYMSFKILKAVVVINSTLVCEGGKHIVEKSMKLTKYRDEIETFLLPIKDDFKKLRNCLYVGSYDKFNRLKDFLKGKKEEVRINGRIARRMIAKCYGNGKKKKYENSRNRKAKENHIFQCVKDKAETFMSPFIENIKEFSFMNSNKQIDLTDGEKKEIYRVFTNGARHFKSIDSDNLQCAKLTVEYLLRKSGKINKGDYFSVIEKLNKYARNYLERINQSFSVRAVISVLSEFNHNVVIGVKKADKVDCLVFKSSIEGYTNLEFSYILLHDEHYYVCAKPKREYEVITSNSVNILALYKSNFHVVNDLKEEGISDDVKSEGLVKSENESDDVGIFIPSIYLKDDKPKIFESVERVDLDLLFPALDIEEPIVRIRPAVRPGILPIIPALIPMALTYNPAAAARLPTTVIWDVNRPLIKAAVRTWYTEATLNRVLVDARAKNLSVHANRTAVLGSLAAIGHDLEYYGVARERRFPEHLYLIYEDADEWVRMFIQLRSSLSVSTRNTNMTATTATTSSLGASGETSSTSTAIYAAYNTINEMLITLDNDNNLINRARFEEKFNLTWA